jgi:BirA family biotin operon repressor/biotin-[acetyl-CoA-carboxylase] ligase
LLAGVATAAAVRAVAGVEARLKWPNDVLAGTGKLAGILAEAWGDAVVVGIGINVSQRGAELPGPGATSLLLQGSAVGGRRHQPGGHRGLMAQPGTGGHPRPGGHLPPPARPPARDTLLIAVLAELERWYAPWRDQAFPGDADACGLRQEYVRLCASVGRAVAVSLPDGSTLTGTATGVDAAGRLEVQAAHDLVRVSAGDVVHVR